jgi:hypothetical protein
MATLNFLIDAQQGANNKGNETHLCMMSIYNAVKSQIPFSQGFTADHLEN